MPVKWSRQLVSCINSKQMGQRTNPVPEVETKRKGILKKGEKGKNIYKTKIKTKMLSLKAWAAINLSYRETINLPDCAISVASRALIEPISKMDLYEDRPDRRGLWDAFWAEDKHVCRLTRYRVRGLWKSVQGRAACWCFCPGGNICNCGCAALLTILMEFRENERWRTKGPHIPEIDLDEPIKNYLFRPLFDAHLFYNVRYPNRRPR